MHGERVVIGVDPHKLSATIEVVDRHETVLASGRFATDKAGYAAMRKHVGRGRTGRGRSRAATALGRPLAQRLLADGEHVVDVPAKLAARARLLDTGHGRKTDAHDAHSVAVAAVRAKELRVLASTGSSRRCGCWSTAARSCPAAGADRQPAAAAARRAHPGQAKKDITACRPRRSSPVRPRDLAGKTRRRLAAEQLADLVAIEKKIKALTNELKGDGRRPRLHADGPAGRRADRRRPHPGRRRRRGPVRRPQPVRVLDRHRAARRLLRASRSGTGSPGPGTGG